MAERTVTYRLKILQDSANGAQAQAFGKAVVAAEKQAAKERVQTVEEAERKKTEATAREEQRRRRDAEQNAKEIWRMRVQYMKDEERKINDLAKAYEAYTAQQVRGKEAIKSAFFEGTESVARFGRGFAALGLIGEENTEKLLKGLVVVQGTFDLVVGGVKTWQAVSKAVEGYRAIVVATAAAEQAARSRNIALINAEIGAEARLGAARAASGGASSVGGAGGLAGLGRFASPLGVGLAIGGTAIGIASDARGYSNYFNSFTSDSVNDSLAGINWGIISDTARERVSRNNLGRAQGRFNTQYDMEESVRGMTTARVGMADDIFGARVGGANDRIGSASTSAEKLNSILEKRRMIAEEIAAQSSEVARNDIEQQAFSERIARLGQLETSALGEQLTIRRQIADERKKDAQERVQSSEKELDLVKQRIGAEQNSLLTAKERFGQLSKAEQQELIAIKTKADAEGSASLTRSERAKLRGVGLSSTNEMARFGDIQDANAAGFDQFFGAEEQAALGSSERQRKQIEVRLQDERKLLVEVQRDDTTLINQAVASLNEALDRRDKQLIATFQQRFEGQIRDNARANARNSEARIQSSGGR
jgi:hypothetical protein